MPDTPQLSGAAPDFGGDPMGWQTRARGCSDRLSWEVLLGFGVFGV